MDAQDLKSVLVRESFFVGFNELVEAERFYMMGRVSFEVYLIMCQDECKGIFEEDSF